MNLSPFLRLTSLSPALWRLTVSCPRKPGSTSARLATIPSLARDDRMWSIPRNRSEEHTSELQSQSNLVCRLLLEKKNTQNTSQLLLVLTRTPPLLPFFFFNDTATTEIYTLSLHDALPISFLRLTSLSPALWRLTVSCPRKPGSTSARLATIPSLARDDRMWSIPRNISDSSTRSIVATSICWPGRSTRLRSNLKSMPAGFSFGFRGMTWNWPVFIAPVISLSDRAIPLEHDDNGFKKASEGSAPVRAHRKIYR